jgi:methyl-accepting chemotaxis protein
MDKVTQQNAAMVEQTSSASRSLAAEATGLARLVGEFRTGEAAKDLPAAPSGQFRKALTPV